ncbi:hypothetical protein [Mogibacterium diversum]|jgi:hypothetical protein|nr:hypothetical protein [Mogibacterium diversum]
MSKVYKITYLNYRVSILFMIPIGIFALFVADKLPTTENILVRMICNIIFILLIGTIFSRTSNFMFKKNGVIKVTNSEIKVTLDNKEYEYYLEDIKEIIMAYRRPFSISLLGNCITLIINPKKGKSLRIESDKDFNNKRLEDHEYSKIFNYIKGLNPTMNFEASITGNFFVLKNNSCK